MFRLPKTDDIAETAYQAHNKYGPKAWYKKARDFILLKKTRKHAYDTESSSSPSSGQDETVLKRIIVRDFSDTRALKEDEKRLAKRSANSILRISRFLYGLFLIQVFHLLITYQSVWDPVEAGVWFGLIGFSVSCGMAFSKAVRAIAVLVIPILCTSSGRAILISYSTMMVLTGPMNNIAHNYGEMSRSLVCGNELGFNITQGLRSKIQEKQFEVLDALDNTIDVIVSVVERAKEIYESIAERIEGIANAIRSINNHIGVMAIVCSEDSSSYICNLPGNIAKDMKKLITQPITKSVQMMRRLFFFGALFDHKFEFHINRTKSSKQIRDDILKEVKHEFGYLSDILFWTRMYTAFSTVLVIYKAASYRKKYLTKNDFDNCYITTLFKHLDRKSGKHGRPAILPLRFKESRRYLSPKRCWMSRAEIKKCFRGWMFVTTNLVWSLFLMTMDFNLYSCMKVLSMALSLKTTSVIEDLMAASQKTDALSKTKTALGAFFTLNIFGKGLVPAIYRAVVRALQQITRKEGLDINIDKCLPKPSAPNFFGFTVIYCILQTCYILVYIQAFMLRLRRYIMAKYYPERERQRIIYLRKKILNNRGIGNVEDLKNTIRSAVDTVEKNQTRRKKSCKARLIMWSNRRGIKGTIARWVTGRTKHMCSLCKFSGSSRDGELFTKCKRPGCAIEYCNPCFDDLHRICPSCLMRHSREKQKIRRLSRILGIEPVSEEKSHGEVEDIMDDFVPSSGISDSSDDDKMMEETTLATEEYLNSIKKEADDTLRALAESNSKSNQNQMTEYFSDPNGVSEGAGTSGLWPTSVGTNVVVERDIVNVAQASEEMAYYNPYAYGGQKGRTGRQTRKSIRKTRRAERERRGLLHQTESDSDLDLM